MPLAKALRALLVLLALLAIVPTQTGGALAVDELGLCVFDDCDPTDDFTPVGIGDPTDKHGPAKPAHHASFAAPDDGTAAGGTIAYWPPSLRSTLPRVKGVADADSASGTRLERPPKSI